MINYSVSTERLRKIGDSYFQLYLGFSHSYAMETGFVFKKQTKIGDFSKKPWWVITCLSKDQDKDFDFLAYGLHIILLLLVDFRCHWNKHKKILIF